MATQPKTINLLLSDGTLHGVISMEDSSWNSGELYSAPRDSVNELLDTDACNKFGVYLLLSQDKVYVGQSSDLAKRLNQHLTGKDWWTQAVILTTKDDSFNHADIDYLESALIARAFKANSLDCENKNRGNQPKVDKFREVFLTQYLEESLFLMKLIGIKVFSEKEKVNASQGRTTLIDTTTASIQTKLALGMRVKSDAIAFLKESGVELGDHVTFSTLNASGTGFWLNPRSELLKQDWDIILNDTVSTQLLVLSIPASTFTVHDTDITGQGFKVRNDRHDLLDMTIAKDTLLENVSGIDLSPYLRASISYRVQD